jgi:hypothetical protein
MQTHGFTYNHALLLSCLTGICACATSVDHKAGNYYKQKAERHERSAADYRCRGIDNMAEHHNNEAVRARHNQIARDCDLFDFMMSGILSDGYSCAYK